MQAECRSGGFRARTIVPPTVVPDKGAGRFCILVLLGGLASPATVRGQAPDTLPPVPAVITLGDVLATTAAGTLFAAPILFDVGPDTPDCAPCDRRDLPGFDRWALARERSGWEAASTLALVGLAVGVELDLVFGERGEGGPHAVALVESAAWALGLTEVLKAAVGRGRPVLYDPAITPDDVEPDDLRSMPSAHTSAAFALATSWWLSRRALDAEPRRVPAWLGFVVAAGVGVMRVSAGRHFPSDVVTGAALGVASAVVVHAVKF